MMQIQLFDSNITDFVYSVHGPGASLGAVAEKLVLCQVGREDIAFYRVDAAEAKLWWIDA